MAPSMIQTPSQTENSKTVEQSGQPSSAKEQSVRPRLRMEELEARVAPCNPRAGCNAAGATGGTT